MAMTLTDSNPSCAWDLWNLKNRCI